MKLRDELREELKRA